MTIAFNSETIHSSQKLIAFLNADDEAQEITEHPQTQPPGCLSNCWTVTWLTAVAPFMVILVVFFKCIEALLHCLHLKSLAIHCDVFTKQLMTRMVYLGTLICNGSDLIAPLFNTYAFSASDVYLQDTIPSPTADPLIARALEGQNKISFHRGGVCRGGTVWFLNLNFLTEGAIPDLETRLRSIASTFYYGTRSRPALLQAVNFPERDLIKMEKEERPSVALVFAQGVQAEVEALNFPAVYEVWLPFHRMAFFKIGAQLGYIVDFNGGILKREGEGMSNAVASHLRHYSRPDEGAMNIATFFHIRKPMQ